MGEVRPAQATPLQAPLHLGGNRAAGLAAAERFTIPSQKAILHKLFPPPNAALGPQRNLLATAADGNLHVYALTSLPRLGSRATASCGARALQRLRLRAGLTVQLLGQCA